MLIRKLFSFEGAHVVRNCTSQRCARSIHGHSYKVEIFLECHQLDRGQMVYDFGLLKGDVRELIDAFDHTLVFWQEDDADYIEQCKQHSLRWIGLPVSPSAEQLSRVFFGLIDTLLQQTEMHNGEGNVVLQSVIVHETATGYAQCFREDAGNPQMGLIVPSAITYSHQIINEASGGALTRLSALPSLSREAT
ncbi:6-pyruvoyl trahydropterin synthase family protein [Herminiimonas aquatilis]|uniref:6-carboxy-5,6,7,8-tetrahydropterin synthase n=1 Tax=Herminiimonas aquatilis TaxID=345342 RepID=A0ABW2J840_9BURK